MLEAQSDHTADIVQFIRPDDAVRVVTGIGFIDVDPKILACRIRRMSWPERARIVSNAISDALEAVDKMSDLDLGPAQTRRLVEWALLEVQRAVGRLLHELGEDEPGDAVAVLIFLLSLDPEHRCAARGWTEEGPEQEARPEALQAAKEEFELLCCFHALVTTAQPGGGPGLAPRPQRVPGNHTAAGVVRRSATTRSREAQNDQ